MSGDAQCVPEPLAPISLGLRLVRVLVGADEKLVNLDHVKGANSSELGIFLTYFVHLPVDYHLPACFPVVLFRHVMILPQLRVVDRSLFNNDEMLLLLLRGFLTSFNLSDIRGLLLSLVSVFVGAGLDRGVAAGVLSRDID